MTIPWLACRTTYSLLRGALDPDALCQKASALGIQALGVADLGNFYGLVRFRAAAERWGIRAIYAMEFSPDSTPGLLAWVLDIKGYQSLNTLASGILDQAGADPFALALDFFSRNGWEGLALALPPGRGETLRGAGTRDLHIALRWGQEQAKAQAAARRTGLPLLAVAGGTWAEPHERYRHDLLRAVDLRCSVANLPGSEQGQFQGRLPAPGEAESFFSCCPEAVQAAHGLAERCARDILSSGFVFPAYGALSETGALLELRARCQSAIPRRFPGRESAARIRLDHELDIIGHKGFASYFLVVADIVGHSPRTCGRGSAASSIVSYLLMITHVDPLRYNLFFERFLHRARKDPPDIDIDFPHDEREATLRYVFDKYPGSSAMVADHVTFASRSALREGVLALGEGVGELDRYLEAWRLERWDAIPNYVWAAFKALKGVVRNLGTHPGGVVIVPGPIHRYVHTQTSNLGWPLIAWEKDAAEDAGLVKIDLLGNRSLGVLRDVLTASSAPGQAMDHWNDMAVIDDPEARKEIESGDTLGVFYVESPATRQLLYKMGQGDYEHLVVASSIIRPAANRYIKDYVDRIHGKPWRPIHPRLGEILAETHGIMVYQEDVSRVAMAVAGFSPEDADALRKVLSKKDRELKLPDFKSRFEAGCRTMGLDTRQIEEIWLMILSFDGYSFCKSHSASYALVSYQLAFLRKRYPLEFYTAVINNGGGFYARQVYLNQVRRLGFTILGPSVLHSQLNYTIEHGALRLGLSQVLGISMNWLERLFAQRSRQSFMDFEDFLIRTYPDQTEFASLVKSGALDCFLAEGGRPGLFWRAFNRNKAPRAQQSLLAVSAPAIIRDYAPMVRLQDEHETLGIWHSIHPATLFVARALQVSIRRKLPRPCISTELAERVGSRVSILGCVVAGKEVITRQAKTMGFVSFEDPAGLFETVVFPEAYRLILPSLIAGSAFLIWGTVNKEQGAISVELDNLFLLNRR